MVPLDAEEWKSNPLGKRDYKDNLEQMTKNINALVRVFSEKQMRDKILKQFSSAKGDNEIKSYNEVFAKLQKLWNYKLCQSYEEKENEDNNLKTIENDVAELEKLTTKNESHLLKFEEGSKETAN